MRFAPILCDAALLGTRERHIYSMRKAVVLFFLVFATSAFGQIIKSDIIGKWNGRFEVDLTRLSQPLRPEQIKAIKDVAATRRYLFEFKADGTFVITTTQGGKVGDKTSGTWKIRGLQVILVNTKAHGKAITPDRQREQPLELGGSKKVLRMQIPQAVAPSYIVLKRS